MRRRFFFWIGQHAVILAGCVAFLLPFGWLLLTSVKQDHELFGDRLWPEVPHGVDASPYSAPPSRDLAPELSRELYDLACEVDTSRCHALDTARFRRSLAAGLYGALDPRLHDDERGDTKKTVAAARRLLDASDVQRVFDEVYRAVRISEAYVWDSDYHEHRVVESPSQWRVESARRARATLREAEYSPGDARRLEYRLEPGGQIRLRLDFASPADRSSFHRFALTARADSTWYAVDADVWVDGEHWRSERSDFLRSQRWLDLAWQVPSREDETPGYKEYTGLIHVAEEAAAPDHVVLTISQAPAVVLAWRKLTANYRDAFRRIPFWKYAYNSALIVLLNVMGSLLVCPLVAYAFARWEWPGRDVLFVLVLATLMLPAHVTMIPVFLVFKNLGWHDSLKPLFIRSFFGNAFFIFLLRQFMKSIPRDLERAARIDGCGFFGVYRHVIVPLIKPSLAAIAIFQFQASWNSFLDPLIYLNTQDLYPLALGLFEFKEQYSVAYGMLMSTSFLMTLPVIVVFFVAQRYFIQGVTLTGLKG